MPKLFIFDAFTLLIREKTVANYALLRCKTFSLKIWVCKIFDKFHVWVTTDVTEWSPRRSPIHPGCHQNINIVYSVVTQAMENLPI